MALAPALNKARHVDLFAGSRRACGRSGVRSPLHPRVARRETRHGPALPHRKRTCGWSCCIRPTTRRTARTKATLLLDDRNNEAEPERRVNAIWGYRTPFDEVAELVGHCVLRTVSRRSR